MAFLHKIIVFLLLIGLVSCGRNTGQVADYGLASNIRIVDKSADVGYFASVQLHPETGYPAISYYDITNGDLKVAVLDVTGDWNIEVVDDEGDVGKYSRLQFSPSGNMHIVYYDVSNQQPKYAFHNGVEWVVNPVAYSGKGGLYLDFQLEDGIVANMSFLQTERFQLEFVKVNSLSGVAESGSISLDNGTLKVGDNGCSLKSRQTQQDGFNNNTSLQLRDVEGKPEPVVVYRSPGNGQLRVLYRDPTHSSRCKGGPMADWVVLTVDADPFGTDVGQWVSSILEGNDLLHISYYDAEHESLKYARVDLVEETVDIEVVDEEGVVGQGSSITIVGDTITYPVINYYDATNNDLKAAVRSKQGWLLHRVDLKGIVGSHPSAIALSTEQVGVAYRDSANHALKFAIYSPLASGEPIVRDDAGQEVTAPAETTDTVEPLPEETILQ